jgi:SAM-dependent methyltransferase
MLREHLSQSHDLASRRLERIDKHVSWIHQTILHSRASRVLDLGCGPGLYTQRLATLGHDCTGIDFSPAAIEYAAGQIAHGASCRYVFADVRTVDYGGPYDLAVMTFGEINVFSPDECRRILKKAHHSLAPGGVVLLELHTFDKVQAMGREPRTWNSSEGSVFSDRQHLCLVQNRWDESTSVAQTHFFVIDAQTADVSTFISTTQAYRPEEIEFILGSCGFGDVQWDTDWQQQNVGFVMVWATKQ